MFIEFLVGLGLYTVGSAQEKAETNKRLTQYKSDQNMYVNAYRREFRRVLGEFARDATSGTNPWLQTYLWGKKSRSSSSTAYNPYRYENSVRRYDSYMSLLHDLDMTNEEFFIWMKNLFHNKKCLRPFKCGSSTYKIGGKYYLLEPVSQTVAESFDNKKFILVPVDMTDDDVPVGAEIRNEKMLMLETAGHYKILGANIDVKEFMKSNPASLGRILGFKDWDYCCDLFKVRFRSEEMK